MPYKTTEQAYAVARSMGCNKIHKMPDGSYMPCGSHAEYNRMKKDGLHTKNHAVPLAVENALRRKMRSHNGRYGQDKKTRATLGALKRVYVAALGTYRDSRAQSRENWAMSKVNTHLNVLSGHVSKEEGFRPPQSVANAARRALEVRAKKPSSQRGMTSVGLARARDLMNRKSLSLDTVKRMKAYFDRHEVDKKGSTWNDKGKGWQAWHGWGGDAGRAWANKIVRLNSKAVNKMNNVLKIKEVCQNLYPVKVSKDFEDAVDVDSWSEFVFIAKSAQKGCHVYKGDELLCYFNAVLRPVMKVDGKKDHSMLPGKHKYRLMDNSGNVIETGWLDDDFQVSDSVTAEGLSEGDSTVEIITLTDEEEAVENIADTIADAATTKEFFKSIVNNKAENGASIVFLSLMPTLDELKSGECMCGSIEKNLTEQIVGPLGVTRDQITFLNIVPHEVLDETGKRSAPSAEVVDEWRPSVLKSIHSADSRAIVVALGKDVAEHYADVVDFVVPHPFSKSKYSLPRKVEELKKAYSSKFDRQVKITKSDSDRRLVYGIVLEPEVVDAHNDVVSIDEIENAAHNYLIKSRMIGDQHSKPAKADIVESYIAPTDLDIGGQQIKKGSWVMVTKVHDDGMWSGIKKGAYTGYSIGGYAVKEPIEDGLLAQ